MTQIGRVRSALHDLFIPFEYAEEIKTKRNEKDTKVLGKRDIPKT